MIYGWKEKERRSRIPKNATSAYAKIKQWVNTSRLSFRVDPRMFVLRLFEDISSKNQYFENN
jgi:hypothetical protein